MGPAASLAGRDIGQDFSRKDGWSMYHGDAVPGFPAHPHRGFETVTVVRKGLIDHSDSLGATARFGQGDVQWLTAGGGIVHSEMFPLLDEDAAQSAGAVPDLAEPAGAAARWCAPHFTMFWADDIPRRGGDGRAGRSDRSGRGRGPAATAPARRCRRRPIRGPRSPTPTWRSGPSAWSRARAGRCPRRAGSGTRRTLYFFKGACVTHRGRERHGARRDRAARATRPSSWSMARREARVPAAAGPARSASRWRNTARS